MWRSRKLDFFSMLIHLLRITHFCVFIHIFTSFPTPREPREQTAMRAHISHLAAALTVYLVSLKFCKIEHFWARSDCGIAYAEIELFFSICHPVRVSIPVESAGERRTRGISRDISWNRQVVWGVSEERENKNFIKFPRVSRVCDKMKLIFHHDMFRVNR